MSGFHYLTSCLTTGALINRHEGYSVVNRIKQQEKVMDQLAHQEVTLGALKVDHRPA
jgi:hypothetical protein